MKTRSWILLSGSFLAMPVVAQVADPTATTSTTNREALTATNLAGPGSLRTSVSSWQARSRSEHQTEWFSVAYTTNAGTGRVRATTNSYVAIATGLNKLDPATGQWIESKEEIELIAGGAIARKGQHQVVFAANINTAGAIDLTTPDGQRLRSHVLGLAYTDTATGKSALIAEVKDSVGEVSGNQVIYRDAFSGPFISDLRYSYTRDGFEQDVIIRETPPSPKEYGMAPETTRMEVWSEFVEAPVPEKTTTQLKPEAAALKPQAMMDVSLSDETLRFGAMRIGSGTAFPLDGGAPAEDSSIQVGKNWTTIDGRDFLIEKVDYSDVEANLTRLPKAAALNPPAHAPMQAALGAKSRELMLAGLSKPIRKDRRADGAKMRMAGILPPSKGFVLDYVISTTQSDATFLSGVTYLVVGNVTLTGTTTIQGNSIIKYTNNVWPKIVINGPVDCQTSLYHPAFFTSMSDDSVGQVIAGSTGTPTGSYALRALELNYSGHNFELQHLRIRHASRGILLSPGTTLTLKHSQLGFGYRAVEGSTGVTTPFKVQNVLIHNFNSGMASGATGRLEHVTYHQVGSAWSGSIGANGFLLTNCLLVEVTNNLAYSGQNVVISQSGAGFFQTVGAGKRYLADGSVYRSTGTPNINPVLLAELKQTTTYPPVVLTGTLSVNTTLAPTPQVVRNANPNPDWGYAYPAMDYLAKGLRIENGSPTATLLLTNGVVVGVDPTPEGYGIYFGQNTELVSSGSPLFPNRLLSADHIQETALALAPSPNATLWGAGVASTPTTARLCFTDLAVMAAGQGHVAGYGTGFQKLTLRDCQMSGGVLLLTPDNSVQLLAFTNTLFEGVGITVHAYAAAPIEAWNNLFRGGSLRFEWAPSGFLPWTFSDNLFDGTVIWQLPTIEVNGNYNAYVHAGGNTTRLVLNGANDQILTASPVYQSGAFGRYYLPSTATALINQGSRDAADAGLFHYTASATAGSKEGDDSNPKVDIGLHFVATGSDGNALDTDMDGLADYLEDKNGNNVLDGTETSFSDPDTDYDGRNDGQELFSDGTNPLNPADGKLVQLGYWRFNDTTWQSEGGGLPLNAVALSNPSSWSGKALEVDSPGAASLKYRDVEPNGFANINCRSGTVRFWFRPNWTSTSPNISNGTGPGGWARLIEVGNTATPSAGWWALSVDPTGASLLFESQINGAGNRMTYFTQPIEWIAGRWQHIAITYTNTETKLYLNGVLATSGPGIQSYPTAATRAVDGLNIGSNRNGNEQSRCQFDELETFNYALTAEAITTDYQADNTMDGDQDGLTDIREHEVGSDPLNPDTDGDGLTDGQEMYVHFTSPLDVDSDYDGRSDWHEVNVDLTGPTYATSVLQTNLAHFTFNGAGLIGAQGQSPKQVLNVTQVPSWSGSALQVAGSSPVNLKYSELEGDNSANFNCREGTIQFWFKPNWSSGTGPGHVARLFEVGDPTQSGDGWWSLSVNSTGDRVRFEGMAEGQTQPTVFMDHYFPYFVAGQWMVLTFTYDDQGVGLFRDAEDFWDAGGNPAVPFPTAIGRSRNGISIGSNRNGGELAEGQFEDFKTFNYVLDWPEHAEMYLNRMGMPLENFSARVPEYLTVSSFLVEVDGAPSGSVAWAFNSVPANPTWNSMQSFNLNLQAGENIVWIGFKDSNGVTRWIRRRIVVDTTPPEATITLPQIINPAGTVVTRPLIQLQGYTTERLSTVFFCLTNALTTNTDQQGIILRHDTDPVTHQYIRSHFQCYDIDLAPGPNDVFLSVVDLAGNTNVQKLIYVLDYSGVTTGPTTISQWPPNGAILSGSTFTFRGYLDDPTATVKVTMVVNGQTVEIAGIVERNGLFWVEDIPLHSGNNDLTLITMNAAGFVTTQTLTLVGSAVTVTVNAIPETDLTNQFVSVQGTISASGYTVWVNGKKAGLDGAGNWTVGNVRVNDGGTATFHVAAIPDADNGGDGTPAPPQAALNNIESPNPSSPGASALLLDLEKPTFVRIREYHGNSHTWSTDWNPCTEIHSIVFINDTWKCDWVNGVGGDVTWAWHHKWCNSNIEVETGSGQTHGVWDAAGNGMAVPPVGSWGPGPVPDRPWEHCDISLEWELGPWEGLPPEKYFHDRDAQSTVELHTGGKSIAHEINLFTVWGSAIGFQEYCGLGPNDPCFPEYGIEPTRIFIPGLGKSLGNDHLLYAQLADNQIIDVTPEIKGANYYHFDIGASKHKLSIVANGVTLAPQHVVPGALFCVGQKVDISYNFEPPVPRIKQTDHLWSLSGKFVNDYWQHTTGVGGGGNVPAGSVIYVGSKNYFVNSERLNSPSTSAWWVQGGKNLGIRLALNVEFLNGQQRILFKKGLIDIHRPLAQPRALVIGGWPVPWYLSPRNPVLSFGSLPVWGDYSNLKLDNRRMEFNLEIHSDFDGEGNFVQLVNCYDTGNFPPYIRSTRGEFWLDNSSLYNTSSKAISKGVKAFDDLSDQPAFNGGNGNGAQAALNADYIYINSNFKSYYVFKPTGNDSIWITLALVTWQWTAAADRPRNGTWTVTSDCPPPVFQASDEFPYWYSTLLNGLPMF